MTSETEDDGSAERVGWISQRGEAGRDRLQKARAGRSGT